MLMKLQSITLPGTPRRRPANNYALNARGVTACKVRCVASGARTAFDPRPQETAALQTADAFSKNKESNELRAPQDRRWKAATHSRAPVAD